MKYRKCLPWNGFICDLHVLVRKPASSFGHITQVCASWTCAHLRLLAGPFDQGLTEALAGCVKCTFLTLLFCNTIRLVLRILNLFLTKFLSYNSLSFFIVLLTVNSSYRKKQTTMASKVFFKETFTKTSLSFMLKYILYFLIVFGYAHFYILIWFILFF